MGLVSQDDKFYVIYISSYGNFSVDWSMCLPKYGKKLTLFCELHYL